MVNTERRRKKLPLRQEAVELSNQIVVLSKYYSILKKDIVFDIMLELNKRFDGLEVELRCDLRLSELLEQIKEKKNSDSYQ